MSVAYVEPLTKSEEIELFSGIVETLPEGYIRDILKDLQPQIVDAVRNDFGFITADLQRDVAELKTERETLRADIAQNQPVATKPAGLILSRRSQLGCILLLCCLFWKISKKSH